MLLDRVLGRMGPALLWRLATQQRNVLRRQSFHNSHCVAREESAAKMPMGCVAGGCSNTPNLENGIALPFIPYFGDDRPQARDTKMFVAPCEHSFSLFQVENTPWSTCTAH